MANLKHYMDQLRGANKEKTDEILFRAAKDPYLGTEDYRKLLDAACGTVQSAVHSIRGMSRR